MERAKHLDELVTKIKKMQGSVKAQLTKHSKLGQKMADLETENNHLHEMLKANPTNPATGESESELYRQLIASKEKEMEELAPKVDAAYEAYAKLRDQKMNRMVQAVREGIQTRLKDILQPAQKVMLSANPDAEKSTEAIEKAQKLLAGCITEDINWKAATCGVSAADPNVYGGTRAYFQSGDIHKAENMTLGNMHLPATGADTATVIHEFGHCLEQDYAVQEACQAFLWHRVGDERPKSMQDVAPGHGYDRYELGRKDEFDKAFGEVSAHYVGKYYQHGASEVLSMGMEKLFTNPRNFAEKDPEYFKFVVGVLDGSLLPAVAQ